MRGINHLLKGGYRLMIFEGEQGCVEPYDPKGYIVSVIDEERRFLSKKSSEAKPLPVLFDLKKGNPLRGRSFAIRYDLERAWKMNIKNAGMPIIREGSRGACRPGNREGKNTRPLMLKKAQIRKKISQYRVLRISLGFKTVPLSKTSVFSNFGESAESFEKGLRKETITQEINDRIIKEVKAPNKLKTPTPQETTSGVIQGIRIESLFFVQYARVKREILIFFPVYYYSIHFTILLLASQALSFFDQGGDYAVM